MEGSWRVAFHCPSRFSREIAEFASEGGGARTLDLRIRVYGTDDASSTAASTSDDASEILPHSLPRKVKSDGTKRDKGAPPTVPPPLDSAATVAALVALPEADRLAQLDALADALRGLPLVERVAFAARLLDRAGG
jgi:hypothetical protein